jgi:drug/metabolite transporter (DMT)-like permease
LKEKRITTTTPVHAQRAAFGVADVLALGLAIVWGSNFVIVKQALTELSPLAFNGLRFAGASLFLLVVLRVNGEDWRIERSDVVRMVVLALISITAYQVCFIYGVYLSTATNTSLIIATSPSLVVVIGVALGTVKASWRTWLGVVMALAGLLLVVGGKAQGLHVGSDTLFGDILAFGSAVTWAIYTLYVPPLSRRYTPLKATTVIMAIGTLPLLALSMPDLLRQDWSRVTVIGWGGLLFSTIMSIALGYVVYYICVKTLGGARGATYFNLPPVFSVLAAFLVLGERLTLVQAVGGAIVVIGVYLTRRNTG